ncbi:MAG: protein kinase, partial [Kofleriaceae bacterium]
MSERSADEDHAEHADHADLADPTIVTPGGLESESLYDSLLRRVAAGSSSGGAGAVAAKMSIRVHAEVGPGGKFVLQQEIGSGAMGRVYRALDRYLLRDVAIKFIFRPEAMSQDDFMALFWQEAHIIARLDQHDNIVRIFDVDCSGYPPFIVMEYLDGQSLEKLLRAGPVDLPTLLHIMIAVACGLGEAHTKGVYHRDLKPSNIFIQKTGRVKLLDFGLARIRNHLFDTSTTRASFVTVHAVPPLASAGTPAYMAPEQWRGESADGATDLWAMGAIMYRLLAKTPPFDADSLAALSARVLSGEPPAPLTGRSAEAPPEICDLVERLLRFDRTTRPSNVSEVVAVLEAVLRRISGEAHHAQLGLAATSLVGRDDYVAQLSQGSGLGQALRSWHKMVLVVVGGIDSAARISAESLPDWIRHQAGVDCEVLHCPAIASGDVGDSAIGLRGFLNTRIKRVRHIFFLTHGDGTDAVLRMLLDEVRRLQGNDNGNAPSDDEPGQLDVHSPFYRTRHVAILRPGRGVATAHHVGGLHASLDTPPLAAALLAETRRFVDATLPTPSIHYIGIGEDAPVQAGSPAVKALAALLASPEMMLAREAIAQTFELDCAARITSLVGPADDALGPDDEIASADVLATVPGADAATQAEVFDELVTLARTQHQRPMVIVIAGDAGVGKSTVLRTATRHLCGELLTNGGAVLPIQIPLYFASLPPEQL